MATSSPTIPWCALVLMRHGESVWNARGRVQGDAFTPVLTRRGFSQVRASAAGLRAELRAEVGAAPVRVSASPLRRAQQTAHEVAAQLGATELVTDSRLREQHAGSMQGRFSRDLVPEATPAGVHVSEVRWGGGESLADVAARWREFYSEACAQADPRWVQVIVGHGIALSVASAVLAGGGHRDADFSAWPPAGYRIMMRPTS